MSEIVAAIGFDNYYAGKESIIKKTLSMQVESAIKHGYTSFIYNHESSFGQWFAASVIDAKKKYPDKHICLYQVCTLNSKNNEFQVYTTEQIIFQNATEKSCLDKEVCQNSEFIITSINQTMTDSECDKFLRENSTGKKVINIMDNGATILFN